MVPICITGRVVSLPGGIRLQSGATHLLKDGQGRDVVYLRARRGLLETVEGRTVRVCGRRRGKVAGEPLGLFEVESGVVLDEVPLRPGLDPFSGPAEVSGGGLPVRPLVGL